MVELAQVTPEAEALLVVVPAAGTLGAEYVAAIELVLGGGEGADKETPRGR